MINRVISQVALRAITAPEISGEFLVEDQRHLVLELYAIGATFVAKVRIANGADVDLSAASTVDNPWYYADLVGLGDGGTTVTGSTGVTGTTATSQKGYAINTDVAKKVAIEVSALSVGSLSAILSRATNE